jgi:hypothetical protein
VRYEDDVGCRSKFVNGQHCGIMRLEKGDDIIAQGTLSEGTRHYAYEYFSFSSEVM